MLFNPLCNACRKARFFTMRSPCAFITYRFALCYFSAKLMSLITYQDKQTFAQAPA